MGDNMGSEYSFRNRPPLRLVASLKTISRLSCEKVVTENKTSPRDFGNAYDDVVSTNSSCYIHNGLGGDVG